MAADSDTKTNEELLRMVASWENHAAWVQFYGHYEPKLRRWCTGLGLDDDSVDEVCQAILIELANRMRTFRYDPKGSFRGWLRRFCESRVVDHQRRRKKAIRPIGLVDCVDERQVAAGQRSLDGKQSEGPEWGTDGWELGMLAEGRRIQESVRARVQPHTWDAFWLVAVSDWTVECTAETLGMTRTAVYAARNRVLRLLSDEGRRAPDRDGGGEGP